MSPYLFTFITISFAMISIGMFSFMVGMKVEGVLPALVKNIAFPIYCTCLFLVWATTAENYTDSVSFGCN